MILLALPTYNEEASLEALLESIVRAAPDIPGLEVLIVDDGCSDGSVAIAESFQDRIKLTIVRHPRNLGLGAALRTCLKEFSNRADADDILVTMDADNSHSPAMIRAMAAELRRGHDIVIASRFVPGAVVKGVPGFRELLSGGLRIFAHAVFPIAGVRDYSSGYRAYSGKYLLPIVRQTGADALVREDGFAAMPELLLRLYLADPRMAVAEAPITLRYDLKKSASKMRVIRNVLKILGLFACLSLRRGSR